MGQITGIAWTDHTFNGWWGCTKISAGCANCYAADLSKRVGGAIWGPGHATFRDGLMTELMPWPENQ